MFSKYWPDYNGNIYLNTENKTYKYEGLNIISTKVGKALKKQNPTWSECLIKAIDIIEEKYFLHLLEDNYLNDFVQTKIISELIDILKNYDVACIDIRGKDASKCINPNSNIIWEMKNNIDYRISVPFYIWDKSKLKKYIRKHENPWQFERYGTIRSYFENERFYSVNTNIFNEKNKIYPYLGNGNYLKRGKWNREIIVGLFTKENINMDFNKRGFYKEEIKTLSKKIKKYFSIVFLFSILLSEFEIKLKKILKFHKRNFK